MAVTVVLSEIQRDTLLAGVADTLVPAVDGPDDPHGFWARTASDLGVPDAIEQALAELPEEQLAGLRELLDALHAQGFDQAPPGGPRGHPPRLHGRRAGRACGVSAFKGLTLLLFYGIADPATGRNPNWPAIGYPGPLSAPPDTPKTIRVARARTTTR